MLRLLRLPLHPRFFASRLSSSQPVDDRLVEQGDSQKSPTVSPLPVKQILSLEPQNQLISVRGWVDRIRKFKDIVFVTLTDRITKETLQIIVPADRFDGIDHRVTAGAAINCSGVLQPSPAPKQKSELHCQSIEVINECPPEILPYDIHSVTVTWTTLRSTPHARSLSKKIKSALLVRNNIIYALHRFLQENEFVNVTTPILTSNDCEGAGETFKVVSKQCKGEEKFFQTDAHLSVSGQLHLESMLNAFLKVYTLNPAFRAENSIGRRHLSEFTMLEIEESFVDSLDQLMDRTESIVRFAAEQAIETSKESIDYLHSLIKESKYTGLSKLTHPKKYLRLTYDEALGLLNEKSKVPKLQHGNDLSRYHEKWLLDYFESYPLFITNYPTSLKPFYMKRDESQERALNFDLLVDVGGELAGGSLREDSYEQLANRIRGTSQEKSLSWYLDLRRMGQVAHGGFGIGVERLIQSVTGINNIRDVIPFPRWVGHLKM